MLKNGLMLKACAQLNLLYLLQQMSIRYTTGAFMDEAQILKDSLGKRIAGEITLSTEPSETIKKWRKIFQISQRELSDSMEMMPSVVSDYESNRRKNPGVGMVKKMVEAMLNIDESRGGRVIKEFSTIESSMIFDAIIDVKEFSKVMSVQKFLKEIGGNIVAGREFSGRDLHGYVVVDSKKALLTLSPIEIIKMQAMIINKALIFTDARSGKTIMAALKMGGLRPAMVVLHGIIRVTDDIAIRISEVEEIPLAVSTIASFEKVMQRLKEL